MSSLSASGLSAGQLSQCLTLTPLDTVSPGIVSASATNARPRSLCMSASGLHLETRTNAEQTCEMSSVCSLQCLNNKPVPEPDLAPALMVYTELLCVETTSLCQTAPPKLKLVLLHVFGQHHCACIPNPIA